MDSSDQKAGWTRDPKNTKDWLKSLLTSSCNQAEMYLNHILLNNILTFFSQLSWQLNNYLVWMDMNDINNYFEEILNSNNSNCGFIFYYAIYNTYRSFPYVSNSYKENFKDYSFMSVQMSSNLPNQGYSSYS